MDILIEIHYLPSIRFFSKLFLYDRIVIDDMEAFGRQSFRNRAWIAGANGVMSLIIPVMQSRAAIPIHEVKIDPRSDWQRSHWQSIRSAYGKSPFFEHYADKLEAVYRKKFTFLFDADWEFIEALLPILKIPKERVDIRSELLEIHDDDTVFYKDQIHPKIDVATDLQFIPKAYQQVFAERNGFIPNLSIIDLLFTIGPEAQDILRQSAILSGEQVPKP